MRVLVPNAEQTDTQTRRLLLCGSGIGTERNKPKKDKTVNKPKAENTERRRGAGRWAAT